MRFNKLDVPHQWKEQFTKYPHGYSIFEAMSKWVKQVNDMITNINQWNEYLSNFTSTFGEVPPQMVELQREMEALLSSVNSDLTTITGEVTGLADTLSSHLNDYATEIGDVETLTTASKQVVGAINDINAAKADKQQEAWITPTLLNDATGTIKYRKNEFGVIEFKGNLNAPISHALTVANGYQSGNNIRVLVAEETSFSVQSFVVSSDGRIVITSTALGKLLSFNGVSYAI